MDVPAPQQDRGDSQVCCPQVCWAHQMPELGSSAGREGGDLVNPGKLQGGICWEGPWKALRAESSALLLEHSTGESRAGLRLVLPKAGDTLRGAGSCSCLDLVCDEHVVPWCPKAGSLILGLGLALWSFGLMLAWPEVRVYLLLAKPSSVVCGICFGEFPEQGITLSSPNLCDTPALRSCHSPALFQDCPSSRR